VSFVLEVPNHKRGLAARTRNRASYLFALLALAAVDHDAGAVLCEFPGNTGADAARRSGDHGHLAGERTILATLFLHTGARPAEVEAALCRHAVFGRDEPAATSGREPTLA